MGECESPRGRVLCMSMCVHVCAYMFAPRCRARFTLYGHEDRGTHIKRITWTPMMEEH